jgi:hypothetical protein
MSSVLHLATALSAGVVILVSACGSTEDPGLGVGGPPDASDTDSNANNADSAGNTDGGKTLPTLCDPAAAAGCGNGRKCDPALGCVECTVDGDCTAAGRDPFCILGRCEACRTNADCGVAAPACFPGDHQCHASCAVDGGTNCQNGNGNNNNATICDPATGACIGCNGPTDCPATDPICEPTTKSCVSCTKNTDCPAARPRCRIPRFECVECVVSADCGANRVCNGDGRCETACTTNQQCTNPNAPKCNVATGDCVQCSAPTDCTAIPNRPICGTQGDRAGRCVQCATNTDCGDGGTPFCDKEGQCAQCLKKQDCPGANAECDNGQCK